VVDVSPEEARIARAALGYEESAMTINAKPVQGRHRATADARSGLPPAVRPLLVGGGALALAAAVVAAVVAWQVV
jgi:hypothetical protein